MTEQKRIFKIEKYHNLHKIYSPSGKAYEDNKIEKFKARGLKTDSGNDDRENNHKMWEFTIVTNIELRWSGVYVLEVAGPSQGTDKPLCKGALPETNWKQMHF